MASLTAYDVGAKGVLPSADPLAAERGETMGTSPTERPGRGTPYPASDKTVSEESVMYDVVQVTGSLLILVAFVAALNGRLDQSSYAYLVLNAVGSAVLAATAVISHEWGFILLEGVWAAVSSYSLLRKSRGLPVAAEHD